MTVSSAVQGPVRVVVVPVGMLAARCGIAEEGKVLGTSCPGAAGVYILQIGDGSAEKAWHERAGGG